MQGAPYLYSFGLYNPLRQASVLALNPIIQDTDTVVDPTPIYWHLGL